MDKGNLKRFFGELRINVVHEADSGWLTCHCPFAKWLHATKTDEKPSFFARADLRKRSGFNCYTCHKSGNIIQLVKSLEHYRKRQYPGMDIEIQLAEVKAGVSFEYDASADDDPVPIEDAVFEGLFVPAYRDKAARYYLREKRMISAETAELLGLMYDPADMRIMFPVRGRRQELYGFTGRTILPKRDWRDMQTPHSPPYGKVKDYYGLPKRRLLLGANLMNPSKPVLMVEGLFAFAAMYEEGCDRLGSPLGTLGSSLSPEQAAMLIEWGNPVFGFYDNDEAGKRGLFGYTDADGQQRKGAAHHLGGEVPLFVPQWPQGLSDPDELQYEDVKRMVKQAKLFTETMKRKKHYD